MRALFVALALASLSVPAASQETTAYEAGVAARLAGQSQEARRLLREWLADHPSDVDAQLQLAYAELALGNLDAAQSGFEAVLRQAPEYADARQGLEAVAARRTLGNEANRGYALIEGAISDLSGGARDWREAAIEVGVPLSADTTVIGRATYYRRFAAEDVELNGQVVWRASENLWLRVLGGVTPHADFRPELTIGGGLDHRLGANSKTVLTLNGSYQRFPLQDVVTVSPGLIRYVSGDRGWFTLRGIGTVADGGPLRVGALIRGDYVPAERWRLFAGASYAPDTDLGVVTRVTSLFAGGEAPLGDRFALTGAVARDWREGGFDRSELRLGIKVRF